MSDGGLCVCERERLTVVRLEGLGLHHLAAVAAHHQVEVVLCWTLAKYGHVCGSMEGGGEHR